MSYAHTDIPATYPSTNLHRSSSLEEANEFTFDIHLRVESTAKTPLLGFGQAS
jgi:hypothetical protein